MRNRFVHATPQLVVLAAVAACSDATAPAERRLEGYFVLATVDEARPPVLVSTSGTSKYFLVTDNLGFDGKSEVGRHRVIREENTTTGQVTVYSNSFTQDYRVRGDSVEIGSFTPCPPNALCVANERGTFTENRLELKVPGWGGRLFLFARMGLD